MSIFEDGGLEKEVRYVGHLVLWTLLC